MLVLPQFSTYVWQSNKFYLVCEEAKKAAFTSSFDAISSVIVEIPIEQYTKESQKIDGECYFDFS